MNTKEMDQAKEIINDTSKGEEFIKELEKKQPMIEKLVIKFKELPLLIEIAKSYIKGQYRYIPVSTIIGIVFTILYIINPLDIIPDTIPGIGQLDDIAVLNLCLVLVDNDIQNYKQWKKENNK